MPIYMSFDFMLLGPIKHGSDGWFELDSFQLGTRRDADRVGQEFHAVKKHDKVSDALDDLFSRQEAPLHGNVAFVELRNQSAVETMRFRLLDVELTGISTSASRTGGTGASFMDTISFVAQQIRFDKGSPAHASTLVRPEDWGRIAARALFSRSAVS